MSTVRERYIERIAEEMLWRHRVQIERAREMAHGTGAEVTAPTPEPTFRAQAEQALDDEIAKRAGEAVLARFREQAVAAERGP